MVQVINNLEDAEVIRFRVHRSTRDPERILASWQHAKLEPVGPKGAVAIAQNEPGASVEAEFQRVLDYANWQGVSFVWLDDPNGLFPLAFAKRLNP